MTMATTIEQQVALVRLLFPAHKDVPEVYMQEFWATAYVHQCSIRFKMNNKKHTVDLESFREMLYICPRIPGQAFAELPFEEEIMEFIRFFGHGATIRTLTDININKLYQPWRSFVAIINKCLTGKSSSYDSFWLSQAQILWGLYHTRSIDYAFLIWEDFVYQVEHKNQKKSNEMYYLRFTKVIIHHFMSKDPSISRRNKINWHYVRDDSIFSMIKVVSRHQNTQQYGAMLHIELTNDEIRNTKAYKEYYDCATREAAPKPKASARRKRSGSDTSITPPTAITTPTTTVVVTPRLTAAAKGKQPAKAKSTSDPSKLGSSGTDEGTGSKPGVSDVPSDDSEEELSWNSSDDEDTNAQEKDRDDDEGDERGKSNDGEEDDAEDKDDDERDDDDDDEQEISKIDEQDDTERGGDDDEESESDEESNSDETREEESFDPIPKTLEYSKDNGNGEDDQGLRISEEERLHEEEEAEELYRDQESSSVSSQFVTSMLNPPSDARMESVFATASSPVAPLQTSTPIMTPSTIATITTISHAPIPTTTIPSEVLQNLPTFDSSVNAQLEAEVLTRSSHSSRTSYAVAADLSEMELKKILIEKMEGNKSIQRSNEQRNLYKALIDAYEADKIILDSYEETVILKRRRDDDDDQEEGPSTGSDRGSKRRRECKEPESASASLETTTRSAGRSTIGSKSRQVSSSESAFAEEPVQTTCQMDEPSYLKPPTPDHDWNKTLPAVQGSTQTWISELAKQADSRSSFNELLDTPLDFSNFIINRLRVDTLTPELLAGLTFELIKGSCTSLIELEYHLEEVYKATTDQLDWVNPDGQHRKYTTSVTKMKAADYGNLKWIEDLVPRSMWIQEPINYDKHAFWESLTGGGNVSSSTGSLLIENLLSMYTPRGGSLLSQISTLWNGIATSI
nr:hypothetical protein [Tanacetum cinerariifolium]